tara:strand:+ start:822 stop:1751 length:930 start_codon:yes stop_codon:yes gene_type:complete
MGRGFKLKSLVTGATGFIGRRLLYLLESSGEDIRVLSRKNHSDYETIICDFNSEDIPVNSLESVDIVYHLAGFAHDLGNSSDNEDIYNRINCEFTSQLAELAVKSKVKRFIFVSSVKAAGGLYQNKCIDESDKFEPEGIYGKSKRDAEKILLEIGNKSGMQVSIIRPSLVYGPNVKGNLGKMRAAISSGFFPPIPDIGNRRSMVHVDDLVRSLLFIASSDFTDGEIYILTDGNEYSSRYIYEVLCKTQGKSVPRWHIPKFVFTVLGLVSKQLKYKIDKLLGDECYSSNKLKSIGFETKKVLKDINETSF